MVIPFLKPPTVVIAYLQNPRERFWGIVRHLDASGLVMQGIDLNSFDEWVNSAVRGEGGGQLSTIFYPLMRVEKVLVDSRSGDIPSLAEQFERRLGRSLNDFIETVG
jgi:hypothetical protein